MLWLWVGDWSLWVVKFWLPFYEICVQNQWGMKFWDPLEDSITDSPSWTTVRMEYLLLAFQYWYCELCVENWWGRGRKHCFVNSCFLAMLESLMDELWWGGGRKSCFGAAEITSFFSQDFSQSNKHDPLRHFVKTGCFYVFLWTSVVSDFCLLEIYKNLGFLLSAITFTVNSHADIQFYKYVYLFQILYSLKSFF